MCVVYVRYLFSGHIQVPKIHFFLSMEYSFEKLMNCEVNPLSIRLNFTNFQNLFHICDISVKLKVYVNCCTGWTNKMALTAKPKR